MLVGCIAAEALRQEVCRQKSEDAARELEVIEGEEMGRLAVEVLRISWEHKRGAYKAGEATHS